MSRKGLTLSRFNREDLNEALGLIDDMTQDMSTDGSLPAESITGLVSPEQGGTGLDTSGSTGVPRVSGGTWSANAGLSHLAASTSADLRGVLSDETGTGAAVFADAPSVTNVNVTDGALSLKGQLFQSFLVEITNTAGTIQHRIYENLTTTSSIGNFASRVSGASTTLTNTPSVNNVTNFATGVGIDASGTNRLVFNTAAQVDADTLCWAVMETNSTASTVLVGIRPNNINVNGTTRNWLGLTFTTCNPTAFATFNLTAANIGAGTVLRVRVCGFIA